MSTMTRYAAFLRGVNLGPTNKVPMPRLRAMAEGLGYGEVRTYINSGNLLFTATGTDLELTEVLQQAIVEEFGLRVDVAVRTESQLRRLLTENPFPDGDPSRVTVAFLTGPPPADAAERLAALAKDEEPLVIRGLEVWVNYSQGLGTSKMAAQFSKAVGVSSTVRNVRTVSKVVAMFD
ncbi:MAG: DUF1697 domain-containing protein [Propionibacteriaceae bacterium]